MKIRYKFTGKISKILTKHLNKNRGKRHKMGEKKNSLKVTKSNTEKGTTNMV